MKHDTAAAAIHPYDLYGIKKLAHRLLFFGQARRVLSTIYRQVDSATCAWTQTPPRHLRLHISPEWFDFRKSGRDQVEFLAQVAGLRPQ